MKQRSERLAQWMFWAWAKSWIALWRAFPVAGGGRVVRALALRPAARAGETVVGLGGFAVRVSVTNPPEEAILLWHSYEEDVVEAARRYLPDGGTALDIGANCGVLSLFMREAVGPAGRVVSVDPSSAACERTGLQAQVNSFRNIEVVEAALTDRSVSQSYRRGRVGIGVLPSLDESNVTGPRITVPEMTLDALVASLGLDALHFVKIDTDGSELTILRGGAEALRQHRPVISAEVNPEGLDARGHSAHELLTLLRQLGYDLFDPTFRRRPRLSRAPHAFETFVPLSTDPDLSFVHNLLAVPSNSPGFEGGQHTGEPPSREDASPAAG